MKLFGNLLASLPWGVLVLAALTLALEVICG